MPDPCLHPEPIKRCVRKRLSGHSCRTIGTIYQPMAYYNLSAQKKMESIVHSKHVTANEINHRSVVLRKQYKAPEDGKIRLFSRGCTYLREKCSKDEEAVCE